MADITVYVEWKLPQRPRKAVSLTIPANTQVKDFLQRTVPEIDPNEILVIIDGRWMRSFRPAAK
ncbi:MAG: hypothetical protein H6Q65_2390 [Firmicutes bacterium]|nr:hypothetical protein [Bacillota bacterium]